MYIQCLRLVLQDKYTIKTFIILKFCVVNHTFLLMTTIIKNHKETYKSLSCMCSTEAAYPYKSKVT